MMPRPTNHLAHWGAFSGRRVGDRIEVAPASEDPDPSPLIRNLATAVHHPARVHFPVARRGWLRNGPASTTARGSDEFVRLPWDEALDIAAAELERVYRHFGPRSVFGGSYGWASAGRFHHAQSQVHRFLNTLGGYVRSVNNYSAGAAMVIIPRVLGAFDEVYLNSVRVDEIAAHTDTILSFGGMAAKNQMICGGGIERHEIGETLGRAVRRGMEFCLVSPLRDDLPDAFGAKWIPITPGTDVALMLALAHELIVTDTFDKRFVARLTTGFDAFRDYVLGRADGKPKSPQWAAPLTGVPVDSTRTLARQLVAGRSLIAVSQSVQRAEHGEQPIWAAIALAAMLGQIGLPGGGFCYGIGSMADSGRDRVAMRLPTLNQLSNPVSDFIPVARVSDMLLHPGEKFDYDGRSLSYPDIRLVYWAGGNPFHHQQDIGRLRRAFSCPETILVHESAWTATARHADMVFPATITLEREDIGASRSNASLIAMRRIADPAGEARDDYEIFRGLAERLGKGEGFSEGRTSRDWLRHIYEEARGAAVSVPLPDFDAFWREGRVPIPLADFDGGLLRRFRDDPVGSPLPTPSGRIELYSKTIAGFGYPDCPGHPSWIPPTDGAGAKAQSKYPVVLVANQPATRLHSQLDFGEYSLAAKHRGREPIRMNSEDAASRGISAGDIVRAYNDRGSFLAAAVPTDDVKPGVAQIATGAWFDQSREHATETFCIHGNPNAVTRDAGTSRLAQGSTGQLTLVQIERFDKEPLPPVLAHVPPKVWSRSDV